MAKPDWRAIQLAGGVEAPISILPAAAAPDGNHQRAGNHGQRWFTSLGAQRVEMVPVIDRASANREDLAEKIRLSRLVYMLGGFPAYLEQTLRDSLVWQAILEAHRDGAVIGGSSAGAMVLCQIYYDPATDRINPGLNLIPNACLIPHHNRTCKGWGAVLPGKIPGITILGIDEQTGMINDQVDGGWTVYGKGKVTLYTPEKVLTYAEMEKMDSIPFSKEQAD